MLKKNKYNGKQSFKENKSSKKAILLESGEEKKIRSNIIKSVCILIIIAGGFYLFSRNQGVQNLPVPTDQGLKKSPMEGKTTYPIAIFNDGKARHYQYSVGNEITVRYFILKSSDGVLRAAFDACDVCWPSGKGYVQNGDVMVCRNCGKQFLSTKINEVKGGCNPAPLQREIVGDNLVIHVKNILDGIKYFDISRRG